MLGGEQPGRHHGEAGLEELRGLQGEAAEIDPAGGALDLAAGDQGQRREDEREGEADHGQAPQVAQAEQGDAEDDGERDRQQHEVVAHQIEAVEADAHGHRRAGRHHQDDAAEHEHAERRQHPAVDRPPPPGDDAGIGAGEGQRHCILRRTAPPLACIGPTQSGFDELAEDLAALLEIGELVEGGGGRRQQHDRAGLALVLGLAMGGRERGGDGAALRAGDAAFEGSREALARLADQEGVGDARIEGLEPVEAGLLRATAEDPVDRLVAGERLGRGVGVGRLAVVDVADVADGRDQLLAVGEAGIALDARDDLRRGQADRGAGGEGGGGVLPVVLAEQVGRVGQSQHALGLAGAVVLQPAVMGVDAAGHRSLAGDRNHRLLPGADEAGAEGAAVARRRRR